MKIIKGKVFEPTKCVLYGIAGIGKTTLAGKFPAPLFIDLERGSMQLDVDRIVPETYAEVKAVISNLEQDSAGYKTLVIDSADWLETKIIQDICRAANVDSIEKYEKGYGKGWTKVSEEWAELLDRLDRLRVRNGMHIVLIGHSKVKKYTPADDSDYDRYTLTMGDRSAEALKKWADMVLFVKYDTYTVEENGKTKVKGNGKRVMYTTFAPCWDAKNRYGLPDKVPFEISSLAPVFKGGCPERAESTVPAAKIAEPARRDGATANPPQNVPETAKPAITAPPAVAPESERITELRELLETSGITEDELMAEVVRNGAVPAGTPLSNLNERTCNRLITHWETVSNNIKIKRSK